MRLQSHGKKALQAHFRSLSDNTKRQAIYPVHKKSVMTPGFHRIITGLFIWALSILPLSVLCQGTVQQQAPVPKRPKVTYSRNMTIASRELNWSQTYFDSYKKTKEAIYLKLAATHCTNAVNVLKATQASLPNTTRFYYKAKNKRFDACRFFKKLQDTALRLDPRHYINDLHDGGCKF